MVWNSGEKGWETEAHGVAAAIQNMLLRARDLGLGSLLIGDIYYTIDTLREHLDKPWKVIAAVSLGYTNSEGRIPPKTSVDEGSEFLI
jgi:nitroreductase